MAKPSNPNDPNDPTADWVAQYKDGTRPEKIAILNEAIQTIIATPEREWSSFFGDLLDHARKARARLEAEEALSRG